MSVFFSSRLSFLRFYYLAFCPFFPVVCGVFLSSLPPFLSPPDAFTAPLSISPFLSPTLFFLRLLFRSLSFLSFVFNFPLPSASLFPSRLFLNLLQFLSALSPVCFFHPPPLTSTLCFPFSPLSVSHCSPKPGEGFPRWAAVCRAGACPGQGVALQVGLGQHRPPQAPASD